MFSLCPLCVPSVLLCDLYRSVEFSIQLFALDGTMIYPEPFWQIDMRMNQLTNQPSRQQTFQPTQPYRLWRGVIRFGFLLLYHELAWSSAVVSWLV